MNKIYILLTILFLSFNLQAQDSCSVSIDSISSGFFQAIPTGVSPFTYNWSWGQNNTDTISYPDSDPLCVTVTDANGCIATGCFNADFSCTSAIYADTDLYCSAQGAAPFTYLWSTGETTESIQPTSEGTYSVTVTTSTGCQSYADYDLSCSSNIPYVYLSITDSLTGTLTIQSIVAQAFAPITYSWNTGETTANIIPSAYGTYSLTVTDGVGCSTVESIEYASTCDASIDINGETLTANSDGTAPFQYLWSTSATTQTIDISPTINNYYVTVTDATGCEAQASYDLPIKDISGIIEPIGVNKRVYLIQHDTIDGTLTALDSIDILSSDSSYYSFAYLSAGSYLIKAATLPLFTPSNYFPTYYNNELFWNDATETTLSIATPYQDVNFGLIEGNNPGGPGFIGGLISEGANFTHNGNSSEGEGDPIAYQIVHLLKQDGTPITYTYTDANGQFSFENLALGDFKLVLDIINKTQAFSYISLDQDHTTANVQFVVNEENIVLSNQQLIKTEPTFTISPNPASEEISILFHAPIKTAQSIVYLTNIYGKTLLSKKITKPTNNNLDISSLPSGTYFINIMTKDKVLTQKMIKF